MHRYIYIYIYTYVCVCVYIYIYIYIYMYPAEVAAFKAGEEWKLYVKATAVRKAGVVLINDS